MLEDNRDLLSDITHRESSKEGAAQFPKLLFDILSQSEVDNNKEATCDEDVHNNLAEASGSSSLKHMNPETNQGIKITSAQEIIRNLPKVWKVLVELLNHQKAQQVDLNVKYYFVWKRGSKQ